MKQLFQCLLLVVLVMGLCGCGPRVSRRGPITYTSQPKPVYRTTQDPPLIAYMPPPKPVKKAPSEKGLVMIDAGHGGKDFGANSQTDPKFLEKNLTLSTAYMLRDYLQQMGYDTVMTREKDQFIDLYDRAAMANDQKPMAFISVHYNHADSREAAGIEVYYYKSDDNKTRTKQSKQLADKVLSKVITSTHAKSRGVKHGNFAVIRETKMPAILVEGGFLSNDSEMEKIRKAAYLKQLAWGIAKGLDDFVES